MTPHLYDGQPGSRSRPDLADGSEEPIRLATYDPAWPGLFAAERARLADALDPWLAGPIEHIGSTAVPNLIAKPTIDIMAAVRDLPSSIDARSALRQLDYLYFPYRPEVMHWFCKPSLQLRLFHLHLVPAGSVLWTERLAFRDFLRRSDEAAAEYAALKTELAAKYRTDREAYTDAKAEFVSSILQRARESNFFDTRTQAVAGTDPLALITACLEAGMHALLVDSDDLPRAFFDLSTGMAGAFVQRLRNYGIRAAMVVSDRTAYSQRFQEFAAEADRDSLFRFVASRDDAVRWLALDAESG